MPVDSEFVRYTQICIMYFSMSYLAILILLFFLFTILTGILRFFLFVGAFSDVVTEVTNPTPCNLYLQQL